MDYPNVEIASSLALLAMTKCVTPVIINLSISLMETKMCESQNGLKEIAVSVIIPTYNRAGTIERAVRSVLNQTFQDFEIIIIDDNSADNTEEIITGLHSEKIRYYRTGENEGVCAARNRGIQLARGKFIIFQDSDDEWLPEKLEEHLKVMEESPERVGVVYSGWWSIIGDKKMRLPHREFSQENGKNKKNLLWHNFISIQSLVRKSVFDKVGVFDTEIPRLEDWELWLKISRHYDFIFIDKPLHITYSSPGSRSTNYEAQAQSCRIILDRYIEEIKNNRELLAYHYHKIGYYFANAGKMQKARKFFFEALKTSPTNLMHYFWLLFSLLGDNFFVFARKVKLEIQKICQHKNNEKISYSNAKND